MKLSIFLCDLSIDKTDMFKGTANAGFCNSSRIAILLFIFDLYKMNSNLNELKYFVFRGTQKMFCSL